MKLSIADLAENCSAEELMIGKEERELTARVKARVLAEIEAESKAAKPKKELIRLRSRRIFTLAFAAALILSFGLVAYAISSIHAARQQELRAEMNMEEHQTESYVEYEVPEESVPGLVLLSTINDGEFQAVYVNVSPVTEEEIAGFPEQPTSFRWQIVGSDMKGFADPWIRPDSSAHTPEEIQALIRRDAYDPETQTLTLCCHIFSDSLSSFLENADTDDVELELFLAEDYVATRSFGRVSLKPTAQDRRSFDFCSVIWVDEASGKEIELVSLELTPVSAILHMRYAKAEVVHEGGDMAMQQEWINVEDSVCKAMRIVFSDGSSLSFTGFLSSSFDDGVVGSYIWWPRAINIYDVRQIILGDQIVWESK